MEGLAPFLKLTQNPSIRKPRLAVELSVSLHCMYLVFSTACWARSCAVGASGSTATIFSYMSLRGCGRSLAICSSSSRYVLWWTVGQCLSCCRESMYWNTRPEKEHRNHIDWKIKNYCILPATHFAVHDSRCAEMCQQVIHHVIILLVHLHHTMICWNKWPQSVLHQLEVAFSLPLAELLQ